MVGVVYSVRFSMKESIFLWLGMNWLVLSTGSVTAHGTPLMYPFGPSADDTPIGDVNDVHETFDDMTAVINLPGDKFMFYGREHDTVYVSDNGVVSFGEPDPGIRSGDSADVVALFWADHFVKDYPLVRDVLWYRLSSDPDELRRAKHDVRQNFEMCHDCFKPTQMLVVTWDNSPNAETFLGHDCFHMFYQYPSYYDYPELYDDMGYDYYRCVPKRDLDSQQKVYLEREQEGRTDSRQDRQVDPGIPFYSQYRIVEGDDAGHTGENKYQMVLVTDGVQTYAIFNYEKIEWIRSAFIYAMVGFVRDPEVDGVAFYIHPFSRDMDLYRLTTESNMGKPGRWMYKISETKILDPTCTPAPSQVFFQNSRR